MHLAEYCCQAGSTWGLRAVRKDPKTPAAVDPIGFKVVMIDSEDQAERLTLGDVDEGCIGKVHRTIPILIHQYIQGWQVGIVYRRDRNRARTDKLPGGTYLTAIIAHEMKQFRQYGF